jgi:tRNA uridine 5-carboxymethylaminomethyl modification enzyme
VQAKKKEIEEIKKILVSLSLEPQDVNGWLESLQAAPITEKQKAQKILLRPDVSLQDFARSVEKVGAAISNYSTESVEQAAIQIKYEVYIEKERELVQRMAQLEELEIPNSFDYAKLSSLGNEAREKLIKIKPRTLGQASRISGINPSDVQILMVYMGR